jgi:hypothetical protein
MGSRLRQQGTLQFYVADFRPAGKNRQHKDDGYHSAEGENGFQNTTA